MSKFFYNRADNKDLREEAFHYDKILKFSAEMSL